jgi:hypothetical protein
LQCSNGPRKAEAIPSCNVIKGPILMEPGRDRDILLRDKSGSPLPLSEDVEDEDSVAGARGVVQWGLASAVWWALIGFAVWILF